ncbi:putative protein-related [Plasmodium yoelii yoelii]|uniref:E2F-associated phosphoprotein n=1 Tax=Plasmodium yoelii yoelii TaxID=73239 RepID=Q7RFJ5_PLAYO|nr:putative protein-related [Plasmodium yoelii yoelii]
MNRNKANNNVINLLINEIKLNEQSENATNLPNEKGINIAKSFLNINDSGFCTQSEDSSLCCCGCFTPVCYQSQRHEYYVNQYRSLFAVNVKINKETILYENEINITKSDNKIQQNECQDIKKQNKEKSETYNPVFCVNCNNHIAYFEIENSIFHFFDVLPD